MSKLLDRAAAELNGERQQEQISLSYDYGQVAAEHRAIVQAAAIDIKRRERRAALDIVEIGRALQDVQDRLAHGQFLPWIEQEFGWQKSMAYNFMAVAEKFPKFGNLEQFGLSALYLLSGPSVPEQAIAEANQLADQGERVTHKAAKAIVDKHRPPSPQPVASPTPLAPVQPEAEPQSSIRPSGDEFFATYRVVGKGTTSANFPTEEQAADWLRSKGVTISVSPAPQQAPARPVTDLATCSHRGQIFVQATTKSPSVRTAHVLLCEECGHFQAEIEVSFQRFTFGFRLDNERAVEAASRWMAHLEREGETR